MEPMTRIGLVHPLRIYLPKISVDRLKTKLKDPFD